MNENIKETIKLHNILLNGIADLEHINENILNKEHKEILSTIKTLMASEIDEIRKELKIDTSTVISENDIK